MKLLTHHFSLLLSLLTTHFSLLTCHASVPLRWTVETSRLQPVAFDVVRGETLALEAAFQSYGKPVAMTNHPCCIFWQTNGMGNAWWTAPASTAADLSGSTSNVVTAAFTPQMDPGAQTVNGFLGSTGQIYRASFTLRFRHGPGAAPNVIDQPPRILDLAHTVVVNPPWPTQADFAATTTVMRAELKTYVDEQITGAGLVTPTMTTNIAGKVVSNVVTKAYVEGLGIEAGVSTQNATNIAQNVVRLNIDTNLLCTVAAAQAMTNAMEASGTDSQIVRARWFYGLEFWVTKVESSYESDHVSWDGVSSTPTSISGYGITDAYTKSEINGNTVTNGGAKAYADATFRTKTDNVCHTNSTYGYTEWVGHDIPARCSFVNHPQPYPYWFEQESIYIWFWDTDSGERWISNEYGLDAMYLSFVSSSQEQGDHLTATRTNRVVATKDIPFVTADNVPSTNGFINAIAATNAAEAIFGSKGPSDIGAYPNTSGQQLASQVATQGAHLNAEDAQFVSTNYDSAVHMPEAYVRIKLNQSGTNVWQTIWEEMRRWNAFTGVGFNWQTWGGFHAWSTNMLALIGETSPKEYAFYDGTTGEVAPDGFFWISQPRIGICAGAGYQRYLDSGCAVWILESNGLVANIGGTTNGYFRISDEEGNTQFEIIKGDKQTVPAIARSMRTEQVMGVTHWICDYAVTNALAAPTAKFCRNLGANTPVWIDDTEASCPCNVVWTPGVNTYTLEFWPKGTEPTMFCKSEYDRGGETRIRQAVPTEMQYIILNGTKYTLVPKTINGELVMGLSTGN